MTRSKYLKGECQLCRGHLEFAVENIGMVVPCPHCGQETELRLAQPPEEATVPRRALVWTGIAVVILGLGLAGALVALKRAQKWAQRQNRPVGTIAMVDPDTNSPPSPDETNSPAGDGLSASAVTLEKAPGTSLIYAVGTVKNTLNRQRFGLKVELDLSDAAGQKIGTASDYRQVLEPGSQWQFKALVVDSKTVSAKLTSVREDQ